MDYKRAIEFLKDIGPLGENKKAEADRLIKELEVLYEMESIGKKNDYISKQESVYLARPIKKGTILTKDLLIFKSPLKGITSDKVAVVLGKKVLYDLDAGDPITLGYIDYEDDIDNNKDQE